MPLMEILGFPERILFVLELRALDGTDTGISLFDNNNEEINEILGRSNIDDLKTDVGREKEALRFSEGRGSGCG